MRRQLYVYDLQRKAALSLGDPAALQENYSVHPEVSPGFWRGYGNVALIEDPDLVHTDLAFQGIILDAGAEPRVIDRGLVPDIVSKDSAETSRTMSFRVSVSSPPYTDGS